MKRLFIRLTGLMVTAAIMLSAGGTALATEIDGQDNDTGVATTQPAEIPDTQEPAPAKEEAPAPAKEEAPAKNEAPAPADNPAPVEDSKAPAEDPAAPAEDPNAPADEPAGAPANDPAAPAEEPAAPAKDEEPAKEPAQDQPAEGEKAPADEPDKEKPTKGSVKQTINIKLDKSNDELAEGYINSVFGKNAPLTKRSFNYESQFGDNEVSLSIYRDLRSKISKIASGEISSTIIECEKISYTAEDLGLANLNDGQAALNAGLAKLKADFDFDGIFYVLLQSSPYDFYWFNKSTTDACLVEFSYSYPFYETVDFSLTFSFKVVPEYQANDEYTVKSTYGTSVITARDNAQAIIEQNATLDDYNKLKAYRDAICDYTDYNWAAAGGGVDYGNPWQMIWVFDGDPNTTVVCEGYSKAFQYLCDNSTFQSNDVYAICVSGLVNFHDGRDPGRHMWNIVHMDDGNDYLVDVTNCDGSDRDKLFLRGKSGDSTSGTGYLISFANSSTVFDYWYDTDGSSQTPDIVPVYKYLLEPEFSNSHSMILSGDIGVRFVAAFPYNYDGSDCYVEFEVSDGKTGTVTYAESKQHKEVNKRYFDFYINALELADTITATLHYGNKTIQSTYSAMSYIQNVQQHHTDNEYLLNLVNSLQDYGYYMQKSGWDDKKTHEPISLSSAYNALNTSDINATVSAVNNYGIVKTLGESGINPSIKIGLALTSQTELRVSVQLNEGVSMVSSGYTKREIDGEVYYTFAIKNISPEDLGDSQTFTIETDHGTATIELSVMHYVKVSLSNDINTAQKLAMVAYYNYYTQAVNYKNSLNN